MNFTFISGNKKTHQLYVILKRTTLNIKTCKLIKKTYHVKANQIKPKITILISDRTDSKENLSGIKKGIT